jgi:serine protease Do
VPPAACLLATVALLATFLSTLHAADSPPDARALRRTRVVEVFENCKDSVVFVTGPVVKSEKASLEEFFVTGGRMPKESSVGTGFVIHKSGFVVTNAHGVERTIAHVVVLADGKASPAELVAVLREQDLALLRVLGGPPLKAARLAQSGDLMIGETVIVIGNPHALRDTCTAGVLSAIGRATHVADLPGVTLRDTIQTDAGINPGSSGSPWFNAVGEVIGMTASMKKDAQNIAFALSAATLRKALPKMLNVERRYGFASGLEVSADGRCEVAAIRPDSPAAKAGLRPGDVITRLADEPVATSLDFHLALIGRKPDQTISLELSREGKPQKVSLTLAPRPKPDAKALLKQKLGLEAVPLEAAKVKAMGLRVARGLVVTAVDPAVYEKVQHPPQVGDVLVRIGFLRPRDPDQAAELVEDLQPGQPLDLVFLRRRENVATRIDIHLILPR